MGGLYKPKIVTYRLRDGSYRTPDGKRVTKNTKGAVRKVSHSKKWYGRYTDGAGEPQRKPLSENKEIARRMLAKLAGDAQLASVNLVDKYADHRRRPLTEHLDDFHRALLARNNTKPYCNRTWAMAKAVIEACGFLTLDDIDAPPVAEFLAELRADHPAPTAELTKEWYRLTDAAAILGIHPRVFHHMVLYRHLPGPPPDKQPGQFKSIHRDTVRGLLEKRCRGRSVGTSNCYLSAVKRFTKWLVKSRRMAVDPLAHEERLNDNVDVRYQRRALKEADFARFVEATGNGEPFWGLAGPDRLVLYTLAANTGFRANELASLTPASFDLASSPPSVTVEASYSKHRKKDNQPLRPDVAVMMRQYLHGKPATQPVWPGTWKSNAAAMVRRDLAAAGIPFEDESGRVFDFHAMRGQFISFLAARGVHPKVAQILARHSTINLTMDYYTHLDVLDVAGALNKLPELPGSRPAVQGADKVPEPVKRRRRA